MAEVILRSHDKVDENGPSVTENDILYETYASVHGLDIQLADRIEQWHRERGLQIGKIAVPARGSWLPASDLSEWFGIDNDHLLPFSVQSYRDTTREQAEPGRIAIAKTMPTREEIEGINFLLLDEVWESGYTLNFIARYLKIMNAASVCVATLYFKPGHNKITDGEPNEPDIYMETTELWADFPWERARRRRQKTPDISTRTHDKIVVWPDEYLAELQAKQAA